MKDCCLKGHSGTVTMRILSKKLLFVCAASFPYSHGGSQQELEFFDTIGGFQPQTDVRDHVSSFVELVCFIPY